MTAPLAIGTTRQFFLDDAVVERLDGCRRRFHRPVRHSGTPLVFEGRGLLVDARAPERPFAGVPWMDAQTGRSAAPIAFSGDAWGALAVEILDAAGVPLAGFSADDFDVFTGNRVRHVASWRGRTDIGALAGATVRLRFVLRNAALYGFEFTDDGPGRSSP